MLVDIVLFKEEGLDLGYDAVIVARLRKLKEVKGKIQDLVIVEARDSEEARKAAENKNVNIILGIESSSHRDKMHFRDSGLNQATCAFCKANNIAVAIPIAEIINSPRRNELIGRVMQNIKLYRKYKIRVVAASFAKNKHEQRKPSDIASFLRSLGMTPKEATDALNAVDELLRDKREMVRKGVRIKE